MRWGSYSAGSQGRSSDSDSVGLGLWSQDFAFAARIKLFGGFLVQMVKGHTVEEDLEKNERK